MAVTGSLIDIFSTCEERINDTTTLLEMLSFIELITNLTFPTSLTKNQWNEHFGVFLVTLLLCWRCRTCSYFQSSSIKHLLTNWICLIYAFVEVFFVGAHHDVNRETLCVVDMTLKCNKNISCCGGSNLIW